MILPALSHKRGCGSPGIRCVSNLKQAALAALVWAHDSEEGFPWQIPLTRTGTLELASSPEVFRHFAILSNELTSPRILICPADRERTGSSAFVSFSNQNLSYFVNFAAQLSTSSLEVALFGDRNVTGGSLSNGFLRTLSSNSAPGWSKDLHEKFGNIAFTDGSVSRTDSRDLQQIVQTSSVPIRLASP